MASAALYPVAAAVIAAVLLLITIVVALLVFTRVRRGWRTYQTWRARRRADTGPGTGTA